MWCRVVWCGVVWCGVIWCGVEWGGVAWCGVQCTVLIDRSQRSCLMFDECCSV
jgi:hypothetical protein